MAAVGPNVVADPKPGSDGYLKWYWTKSPAGLAQWTTSPHPWTALYTHLLKYLNPDEAKKTASVWFFDVTGFHSGTPHVGLIRTGK
jgi:hypothetical protein